MVHTVMEMLRHQTDMTKMMKEIRHYNDPNNERRHRIQRLT